MLCILTLVRLDYVSDKCIEETDIDLLLMYYAKNLVHYQLKTYWRATINCTDKSECDAYTDLHFSSGESLDTSNCKKAEKRVES